MKQIALLAVLILLFTSDAFSQSQKKVSAAVQREIVQQMVADHAFTNDCVREAGGASEAVIIKAEDLNRDGKPEFFVEGKNCGLGARRADGWIYRKTSSGYEQILYVNSIDNIIKLKTRTKGYLDLKVTSSIMRDTFSTDIYKFDGTRYQHKVSL